MGCINEIVLEGQSLLQGMLNQNVSRLSGWPAALSSNNSALSSMFLLLTIVLHRSKNMKQTNFEKYQLSLKPFCLIPKSLEELIYKFLSLVVVSENENFDFNFKSALLLYQHLQQELTHLFQLWTQMQIKVWEGIFFPKRGPFYPRRGSGWQLPSSTNTMAFRTAKNSWTAFVSSLVINVCYGALFKSFKLLLVLAVNVSVSDLSPISFWMMLMLPVFPLLLI